MARGREMLAGIGRAAGGAIFFSLPLLMTMEMWRLGFYMGRLRLVLIMLLVFPLLVMLDRVSGFKDAARWRDDVADALIAYGVGFVTSGIVLAVMNIIHVGMSPREVVGMTALQSVPASFGAVLASSQLWGGSGGGNGGNGGGEQEGGGGGAGGGAGEGQRRERKTGGYGRDLFLMAAGAIFFAFNVAPTEEMILIAFRIGTWQSVALVVMTVAAMHAFVYAVNFSGAARPRRGARTWEVVLRYAVPGYVIACLVSAYVLWTFGRYEGHAPAMMARMAVVLAFPAGLGAAAARLVI